MNFLSTKATAPLSDLMKHPATTIKTLLNDGAYKLYTDGSGYAQMAEITLPQGRVLVIKDYEELAAFAHYKSVMVLSPDDNILGSLNVVPEDRKRPHSTSRFFYGNELIGTGTGDIGMIIASQLLNIPLDPRQAPHTTIDPSVITSIKNFLQKR